MDISEEKLPIEGSSSLNSKEKTDDSFILKERYEILFSSPLPEHNANGAIAYDVKDLINAKRQLFALVCNSQTSPRLSLLSQIKSIKNPHLMEMIEYGIAQCPPENIPHFVLIYQKPSGPRFQNFDVLPDYRKDNEKFAQLLTSFLSIIEALKISRVTHRAIRLDNLYFRDESYSEIILGDCVASFPGFHQPPAYETIESLMSDEEGRGDGNEQQDIYAVGVVALSLLYKKELLAERTVPEVLRLKLKNSSYTALTSENKMPNTYVNLFKGLLNDCISSRWNSLQTLNFLEGKPVNFNLGSTTDGPRKSLIINGEKLYTSEDIAFSLLNNPQEGLDLIHSGKLLEWIKIHNDNEKLYNKLEKLFQQDIKNIPPLILLSKTSIYLNPKAPIRYENVSVFPDGIAKAIFFVSQQQGNLKPFIDIFSHDLIKTWYMEQTTLRSPANATEFRIYINRNDYGYGIERIMYDIDNDLPCASPILGQYFIISMSQILKALDNTYAQKVVTIPPFDKTIIAYLRCKLGKAIDTHLSEISSSKQTTQISGILGLYAYVQQKFGPAQLPHLAQWLINYSLPLIKSYHNLKYQKYLEHEIVRLVKEGNLQTIYNTIENEAIRSNDLHQYIQAIKDTNNLIAMKNKLQNNRDKWEEEIRESALHFASILGILITTFSLIINIINWVLEQ